MKESRLQVSDREATAQDCAWSGPPFRWDESRRFLLLCELDAAFFHLYGINRDDAAYILDTFPIVKRKDIARPGLGPTPEDGGDFIAKADEGGFDPGAGL
jgi:hypothetical protein